MHPCAQYAPYSWSLLPCKPDILPLLIFLCLSCGLTNDVEDVDGDDASSSSAAYAAGALADTRPFGKKSSHSPKKGPWFAVPKKIVGRNI